MFQAEVEENVIAEASGHKSLRSYEHTSQEEQQNVSSKINASYHSEGGTEMINK